MTCRTVDHLLHYMPTVAREATDPWAKKFAADMARRRHWRGWQPTAKQCRMMDRLVSELFAHRDEIDVIEEPGE